MNVNPTHTGFVRGREPWYLRAVLPDPLTDEPECFQIINPTDGRDLNLSVLAARSFDTV